ALLTVPENANAGWTATLAGKRLAPMRADGWAQGWLVPAGAGGTVTLSFGPGRAYGLALGAGLVLAVCLLGLAAFGGQPRAKQAGATRAPATRLMASRAGSLVAMFAAGYLLCGWIGALLLGVASGSRQVTRREAAGVALRFPVLRMPLP